MVYYILMHSCLTSEDYHLLVVLSLQCVSCLATVQSWVLWRKAALQTEAAASSMSVDVRAVLGYHTTQLRAIKNTFCSKISKRYCSENTFLDVIIMYFLFWLLSMADCTFVGTFFPHSISLWRPLVLFHYKETCSPFASHSVCMQMYCILTSAWDSNMMNMCRFFIARMWTCQQIRQGSIKV